MPPAGAAWPAGPYPSSSLALLSPLSPHLYRSASLPCTPPCTRCRPSRCIYLQQQASHTPCSHGVKHGFSTCETQSNDRIDGPIMVTRWSNSHALPASAISTERYSRCNRVPPEYWDQCVTSLTSFQPATRRACQDISNERNITLLGARRVRDPNQAVLCTPSYTANSKHAPPVGSTYDSLP